MKRSGEWSIQPSPQSKFALLVDNTTIKLIQKRREAILYGLHVSLSKFNALIEIVNEIN
ncbi:hypothetical protein N824_02165 [Pedobacter sp. V48]|nr:hypothetical protein N824_02165 [Pedobacter sp. V48]